MSIFYINDGGPYSLCFDESDNEYFLEKLRVRFSQIKNNTNPRLLSPQQKHWKCTKLCDYAKNNWPGTDVSMCRHVSQQVQSKGMDEATKECTREGFSIGYYDAPG